MKKNAIELTKKETKAAAKFGTTEYKQLQEARRDYPTFSVVTVTRKTTTKKNTYQSSMKVHTFLKEKYCVTSSEMIEYQYR